MGQYAYTHLIAKFENERLADQFIEDFEEKNDNFSDLFDFEKQSPDTVYGETPDDHKGSIAENVDLQFLQLNNISELYVYDHMGDFCVFGYSNINTNEDFANSPDPISLFGQPTWENYLKAPGLADFRKFVTMEEFAEFKEEDYNIRIDAWDETIREFANNGSLIDAFILDTEQKLGKPLPEAARDLIVDVYDFYFLYEDFETWLKTAYEDYLANYQNNETPEEPKPALESVLAKNMKRFNTKNLR